MKNHVNDEFLQVCYFGTYRRNYQRNQLMIAGLQANGVKVIECHSNLWYGIDDRVQIAKGGWVKPKFWGRVLSTYWALLKQYKQIGDYDVMVLGYPGQIDVFLARLLTWIRRKPLVLDVLMSIYQVAIERSLKAQAPLSVYLLRCLEWMALRLPDFLIQNTEDYIIWFGEVYGIPQNKFGLVPMGADDRFFKMINKKRPNDGIFRVMYYGTFIPNHGIDVIVNSAHLLEDEEDIQFSLIGEGPELDKAKSFVEENNIKNIQFIGWLEKTDLAHYVANANVCLGVFATTKQSLMTIHNKIYEGLALGIPVISGESPAAKKIFKHKKHIYFCERNNAKKLAESIMVLKKDPILREKLSRCGNEKYQNYSIVKNGLKFKEYLLVLIRP